MEALFSVQEEKDYLISKVLSVFAKTRETYDEFTGVSETEYIFGSKGQSFNDIFFYTEIVFTLSSKSDYPIIRLDVFGDNTGRLDSYQLFLLTSTNERFSFEGKIIADSKGLIASVSLPYEIAKIVLRDGTQFSLRSQALRLDGELGFHMRHSSEIFRLMMNDKSFSDDEIDDLYDGVCDGEVEEKKYWERLRQLPDRAGKKRIEEEEVKIMKNRQLEEKKRQGEEKRKQRLEEEKRQEEEKRKQRLEEEKRLEEKKRKQQQELIEDKKKIKDSFLGCLIVGIWGYWLTTRYATIWNVIGWILLIMDALTAFSVISDIKRYRRKNNRLKK